MNPSRKIAVPIRVSDHARDRARERFPGFKAARIIDEVRAAFKDGRISTTVPPGWIGEPRHEAVYAWTPDGARLYAIGMSEAHAMVVITTVRAGQS